MNNENKELQLEQKMDTDKTYYCLCGGESVQNDRFCSECEKELAIIERFIDQTNSDKYFVLRKGEAFKFANDLNNTEEPHKHMNISENQVELLIELELIDEDFLVSGRYHVECDDSIVDVL